MRALRTGVLLIVAVVATVVAARAATGQNAKISWYTNAIVKLALTPNYASGYGTIKATFGTQPAPVPGSAACFQGCSVDFGNVISGTDYLYRFAAHLNVFTNDPNGFNVYGEGAADFTDSTGDSMAVGQSLFYLTSVSGGSDPNTGYSSALPFMRTSGTVNPAVPDPNTPPSIAYTSYPAPLYASSTATADYYQDYQLKVPPGANGGDYFVWVVYTVVPR